MLAAQATLIGLVFPIAIALVTLLVQRDETSNTLSDIQVYYDQSLAYRVGASAIGLSLVLVLQLVWPAEAVVVHLGFSPTELLPQAVVTLLTVWLVANLVALWNFLRTSLSFIRPSERAILRRRFAANSAVLGDIARRYGQHHYMDAGRQTGLVTDDENVEQPSLMFGMAMEDWGTSEVTTARDSNDLLHDVWLRPLVWVIRRWWRRSVERGIDQTFPRAGPALQFAPQFGLRVPPDGVVCRQNGGAPLTKFEHHVLRICFRFRSDARSNEPADPSDMLEELGDRVVSHVGRLAETSFGSALDEMLSFHRFLIDSYATVNTAGDRVNFSQLGDWGPLYRDWIQEYVRIFERAVEALPRTGRFVSSLSNVHVRLLSRSARFLPSELAAAPLDLANMMVHRLENWVTERRLPRSQPDIPGHLPGSDQESYERALRGFIGGWEAASTLAGQMYLWRRKEVARDEAWKRYVQSWPYLLRHLRNTTYLVAAACRNEDVVGSEMYRESLVRWLKVFEFDMEGGIDGLQRPLTPAFFSRAWIDDEGLAEAFALYPFDPPDVFGAALQSAWQDATLVASGVLLAWYAEGQQESLTCPSVVRGLLGLRGQGGARAGVFKDMLLGVVRMLMAGQRYDDEGYGATIDGHISTLDGVAAPHHISGRTYEVTTKSNRDDLLLPWAACMIALLPDEGDDGAVAAVSKWTSDTRILPDGDLSLRSLVQDLHHLIGLLTQDHHPYFGKGGRALVRGLDVEQRVPRLHAIVTSAVSAIEEQRVTRLRASAVDVRRVEAIRVHIADRLAAPTGGIDVFRRCRWLFEPVDAELTEKRISGVAKGALIEPPMASEASNFLEAVSKIIERAALDDVWRSLLDRPREVIDVLDEANYRACVRQHGDRVRLGGTPILLVPGWNEPTWIRAWLRPAGVARSQRPPKRSEIRSGLYLGTAEGVDIYGADFLEGRSMLVREDLLESIVFEQGASGSIVGLSFEETNEQVGNLVFSFKRELRWRDGPIIELRHAPPVPALQDGQAAAGA